MAFCWAIRQSEGKACETVSQPFIRDREAPRFGRIPVTLLAQHPHLQIEDLVKAKALTRRFEFFLRVREMHLQQRFAQSASGGREERTLSGRRVHDVGCPIFDDLLHHLAQPLLCDALGQ